MPSTLVICTGNPAACSTAKYRGCKSGAVSGSEEGKADNEVDFWQAHMWLGFLVSASPNFRLNVRPSAYRPFCY
jgi:hypothetical protein